MMSSRILARRVSSSLQRSKTTPIWRTAEASSSLSTLSENPRWEKPMTWVLAGALVAVASIGSSSFSNGDSTMTSLDGFVAIPMGPTVVDEPAFQPVEDHDDSLVKEPVTGISFSPVFESKELLGVGVRKKYQFVNVYAMAVYVNPEDFRGLNVGEFEEALLDPHRHRTIRIIMNRTVTMKTVIAAIVEAVEPRMHGKDLHALDHFAQLRNYGSLNEGDDIILTIRSDSVECKCRTHGGCNVTTSEVFARAILDVYFGKATISPTARASVLAGIRDL